MLDIAVGYSRINLERNKYGHNTIKKNSGRSGRDPSVGEGRSREDGEIQKGK